MPAKMAEVTGVAEKARSKPYILPMWNLDEAKAAGTALSQLLKDMEPTFAQFKVTITGYEFNGVRQVISYTIPFSPDRYFEGTVTHWVSQDKEGLRQMVELKADGLRAEDVDRLIDRFINGICTGLGCTVQIEGYAPDGVLVVSHYPLITAKQREEFSKMSEHPLGHPLGNTVPSEMAIVLLPQIVKNPFNNMHIAEVENPRAAAFERVVALVRGSDSDILKALSGVFRYKRSKPLVKQSVSEHSFGVAYLAWDLSNTFNNMGIRNLRERVMGIAVHHDCDEANRIGDIDYHVKHEGARSERLRKKLERVIKATVRKIAKSHSDTDMAYQKMLLMKAERDRDTVEAKIVKLADILETIPFLEREIEMRGKRLRKRRAIARQKNLPPPSDPRIEKFTQMLHKNVERAAAQCDAIVNDALTLKARADDVSESRQRNLAALASEIRSLYLGRAGTASKAQRPVSVSR